MLQFLNPNTPKSISHAGLIQTSNLLNYGKMAFPKINNCGVKAINYIKNISETFRAEVVRSGKLLAITSLLPF
jgi:hypothetical protein